MHCPTAQLADYHYMGGGQGANGGHGPGPPGGGMPGPGGGIPGPGPGGGSPGPGGGIPGPGPPGPHGAPGKHGGGGSAPAIAEPRPAPITAKATTTGASRARRDDLSRNDIRISPDEFLGYRANPFRVAVIPTTRRCHDDGIGARGITARTRMGLLAIVYGPAVTQRGHTRMSTYLTCASANVQRRSITNAQRIASQCRDNYAMQRDGELDNRSSVATAPARMARPDGSAVEVLVVDDEPALGELVSMALRYEGFNVTIAQNGTTAIRLAGEHRPDVVVLDIMLPDMSGLDVLHALHRIRPELPVLFLTAKDTVEDRIAGLSAGGDDYVTKPFSVEEMVLRLRALLRRTGQGVAGASNRLVVGDLVLDEDSFEVSRGGVAIQLTATEFAVLRVLMRSTRRVLTKNQILHEVWDYDFDGRSNVVELYISYLRKKVDANRTPMIHTVRGVGYVLKPQ